jgi:hypothetical protein
MGHRTLTVGEFVVSWANSPLTAADTRQMLTDYRMAHLNARRKIVRVLVLCSGSKPPDDEAKIFIAKHLPELNSISSSVHYVIAEKSPFRAASLRMFAVQAMSMKGVDTYVHENVADALARAGMSPSDSARVIREIESQPEVQER